MLQFCLVNIVLVLPHTDGFGIYLYEFRQRVGKASSYAHGTAHGDIVVGELLACYFRSGIHRGTILADEEYGHAGTVKHPDQVLRLPACRAVSYCHGLYAESVHQSLQSIQRLHALATGRVGEDGFVVQEIALFVQTHHLASGAESRVDAHDALLSQRSGKQQLAQVGGKDTDGLLVGTLLGSRSKFRFYGGLQQTLVGIGHGHYNLLATLAPCGVSTQEALHASLLVARTDVHTQETLALAAPYGKQAMAGATVQRFGEVEVCPVVHGLLHLALYHAGGDDGGALETLSECIAHTFVLVHPFRQDVPRTLQGIFYGRYFFGKELACILLRIAVRAVQYGICQGFETTFPGHFGTRLALGLVGQVYVLQHGGVPA